MSELALAELNDLHAEFDNAQRGLSTNLAYYESEAQPQSIGVSIPPEMRNLLANIGWARTYVDSLEERSDLEGFRLAGKPKADDKLWSWWQANGLDEGSSWAHTEALIHGRAYVIVSAPDPDDPTLDPEVPLIEVKSPTEVWADIDPRTRKVKRAIQVIKTKAGTAGPDYLTVYLPNSTTVFRSNDTDGWTAENHVQHDLGVVPVVPILNRKRLSDRCGSSEITTELRSVTDSASRTMMTMAATAELMAIPQRLLFGVKPEEVTDDPENRRKVFEAYLARILAFEDPEGKAQQFTAAELRNFTEVLDQLARQAATYTGLPPQYLTVTSDNPASAEAIKASESRLVKKAERKNKIFGAAWEQVMRIAMLVMDGEIPKEAFRLESLWRDPSTPTFAAKADAIVKLATAVTPDGRPVIPVERARIDLGYTPEERKQMERWDNENPVAQLNAIVGAGRSRPPDEQEDEAA